MKRLITTLLLAVLFSTSYSQRITTQTIFNYLINESIKVDNTPCTSKHGMLVTNRGLNRFFADKIGSYLAEEGDISLFQNYATLDAEDGKLTINHNFIGKEYKQERIITLSTIGIKTNLEEGFASIFSDRKFNDELGITFKQTFFSKGRIFFSSCGKKEQKGITQQTTNIDNHKSRMHWERKLILDELIAQITQKSKDFESSVRNIETENLEHLRFEGDKATICNDFYTRLATEFMEKFAELEAKKLAETESFNLIKSNWTTLDVFLPVTPQRFSVSENFITSFGEHKIYPWSFSISHNRIWESRKSGRFFLNVSAGIFNNNNITTEELESVSLEEYKNLGGTDTLTYARLSEEDAYIGSYQNFMSSKLSIQGVWFPKNWNIGVSLFFEKNLGKYDPFNGKLGIPIRFNDKEGDPTVNFEIQFKAFDMGNSIEPDKKFSRKFSAGISVGLPFSSIIY